MENALKRVLFKPEEKPDEMREAIREVCHQLDCVQSRFEMETDSDMIESCIFEMESLRARYRYLIRLAKSQGATAVGLAGLKEMNG